MHNGCPCTPEGGGTCWLSIHPLVPTHLSPRGADGNDRQVQAQLQSVLKLPALLQLLVEVIGGSGSPGQLDVGAAQILRAGKAPLQRGQSEAEGQKGNNPDNGRS